MNNFKVLNTIMVVATALSYVAQGVIMVVGGKHAKLAKDAEKAEIIKEVLDKMAKK